MINIIQRYKISSLSSTQISGYEGIFENNQYYYECYVFRQAWEKGEIDENILLKLLGKSTVRISEYYLQQMAS
jgi:hypothetical protein